jgi:hypothetical protein
MCDFALDRQVEAGARMLGVLQFQEGVDLSLRNLHTIRSEGRTSDADASRKLAYSGESVTVAITALLYRRTPVSLQKKNRCPVTPTATGFPFIV